MGRGELGVDAFDKAKHPSVRFVGLGGLAAEYRHGTINVVPVDVPVIASQPNGGSFNIGDCDGDGTVQGD